MPCGHILECTDELPPTVREGAIQERGGAMCPAGTYWNAPTNCRRP